MYSLLIIIIETIQTEKLTYHMALCSAGHHPSPSTLCFVPQKSGLYGRVVVCDYAPYGPKSGMGNLLAPVVLWEFPLQPAESEASLWVIVMHI